MQAFLIPLDDHVDGMTSIELTTITRKIADEGINLTGFAAASCDECGAAVLLTSDDAATRAVLQGMSQGYFEYEVVEVTLPNEPGSLATAAGKLADASIAIEAAIPTGMDGNSVVVGFVVSHPEKARSLLQ